MYDIILNSLKFAFSEDARKGASAILDRIQKSPEWQKDICTLEARVEGTHPEHASLLAGLAASKLNNLKYPAEAVQAFRTSYVEITNNAFQHGSVREEDIKVRLEISSEYISVTVTNAKGRDFDLSATLTRCRATLESNPQSRRGRGLLLIEHLADSFEQIGKRAIKAVFFRDHVVLERVAFEGIVIFRLNGGVFNPSLSRKVLLTVARELNENDVVLDVSEFLSDPGSDFITVGLRLAEIGSRNTHKFVVLVAPGGLFHVQGSLAYSSWADVLTALDKKESEGDVLAGIGRRKQQVIDSKPEYFKRAFKKLC